MTVILDRFEKVGDNTYKVYLQGDDTTYTVEVPADTNPEDLKNILTTEVMRIKNMKSNEEFLNSLVGKDLETELASQQTVKE